MAEDKASALDKAVDSAVADTDLDEDGGSEVDTTAEAGHIAETQATPPEEDIDALISKVDANWDKIPPEKRAALDRHFQPAFNRNLNLLRQKTENSVGRVVEDLGIKLPEGKTAFDLLTEGNGEEFLKVLRDTVAGELRPVRQDLDQRKTNDQIFQMATLAQQEFPEVRENFKEAVALIDSNPDLVTIAQGNEGRNLPYLLRGAAATVVVEKQAKEIAELKKQLKAVQTIKQAGASTSRAGLLARSSNNDAKLPKGRGALDAAITAAEERLKARQA